MSAGAQRGRWWGLGSLVWLGCASTPAQVARESDRWLDQVPWSEAREQAAEALSAYVAVDTSNPPGREVAGAALLAELLARDGIVSTWLPFAEGRGTLVARLPGSGAEAPLCLMSHLDVATADPAGWTHPPFSGLRQDGYVWGRGALDMKGVGIAELYTLVWLKRLGVPLRRDVVLLAVADEEVGSLGARALASEHWHDIGCSHLLNEGGIGVQGGVVPGLTTYAISVAEKGSLWLRLVASGPPGHGSTPLPDSAPAVLQEALGRIAAWQRPARYSETVLTLAEAVGARAGGAQGLVLRTPWLLRTLAGPALRADPLTAAMLVDTVNVTGFGGAEAPNVVPAEVWAQLDVRVLPDTSTAAVQAQLAGVLAGLPVRLEVIEAVEPTVSPMEDPLYRALERAAKGADAEAAVGPLIMMGTTDSTFFRALGVRAYGVALFAVPPEELRGMHGVDERLAEAELGRGLRALLQATLEVAAE